jgi:hypothetical protein
MRRPGEGRRQVGLRDLPLAHQQRAQAQVVAGGGREHGRALAQVELGLLVPALHDQHAGAVADMEERQQAGDLEAREISFEHLFHGEGRGL